MALLSAPLGWCYCPNNKAGGPSWYGPVSKDCKADTAEESTFLKRGVPITDDNLADAAMKKEISKRWESLKTPWRGEDNLCFKDPYGGLVDCDFCECSEGWDTQSQLRDADPDDRHSQRWCPKGKGGKEQWYGPVGRDCPGDGTVG
ncbi:MAG: hypothetical protein LQ350_008627 [Teloschistes chrysophthalmus]|nr:MAG: hypothetical protein LQ350_008627 [Niorma chrysophthalma]